MILGITAKYDYRTISYDVISVSASKSKDMPSPGGAPGDYGGGDYGGDL